MKVYEYPIEISLSPAFDEASKRGDVVSNELRPLRERYFTPALDGSTTQEKALINLFSEHGSHRHKLASENGYIGSYHNCVLRLLYAVFGVDILAYLFDQEWVPSVTIAPFRPDLFLERLSVLERAAKRLKDGMEIPVRLTATSRYFKDGMGPDLECFCESRHRLLVEYSLRELRAFGELANSSEEKQDLRVLASIYWPYDLNDPEIDAFTAKPEVNEK